MSYSRPLSGVVETRSFSVPTHPDPAKREGIRAGKSQHGVPGCPALNSPHQEMDENATFARYHRLHHLSGVKAK